MREGTLFPGERVHMFFQLRSLFPSGRFTVWILWGKELYSPVREYICSFGWESFFPSGRFTVKSIREGTLFPSERVHMFFQLRIIFPSGRFTVWSLWGKELYSPVREYTCSFSWESFFPLEGLQCGVYEGRNSIIHVYTFFQYTRIHVLSVEEHFSLRKVYSV